jgi:hypothetical protein
MVEDRQQSGLLKDRARDFVSAAGKGLPLRRAQPQLRRDSSGHFGSNGVGAVVVREHQKGLRGGGHGGQQARRSYGGCDAGGMGRGILHRNRHECAQHDEVAPREFSAQSGRIRGHIAPVAQLRCGVAGLDQLVQHTVKRDLLALVLVFQRAPGTGGIANH